MLERTKKYTTASVPWAALIASLFAVLTHLNPPKPVDPVNPPPIVEVHTAPYAKLVAPSTGKVGEPIVVSCAGSMGKSIKLREQGFDKESGFEQAAYDSKGLPLTVFMARKPLTLHSTLVVGQGDETDIAQSQTVFTGDAPVPPKPPVPPVDPPKPPDPPKPVIGDAKYTIFVTDGKASSPVWLSLDFTEFLKARGLPAPAVYDVSLVAPNADAVAMKWIGLTANRGNKSYPYFFISDANGNVLEEGVANLTGLALNQLIAKHLSAIVIPGFRGYCPTCPQGGCQ